jgi:hypothetical protein
MKITEATRPSCFAIPSWAIALTRYRLRDSNKAAGGRREPKAPERPASSPTPASPPAFVLGIGKDSCKECQARGFACPDHWYDASRFDP